MQHNYTLIKYHKTTVRLGRRGGGKVKNEIKGKGVEKRCEKVWKAEGRGEAAHKDSNAKNVIFISS